MTLSPGSRLGRYEILRLLGRGGMGEVYKARDSRLDRTVAVKVPCESAAGNADHRARFEREARVISALEHPNICAVYDVGEENGVYFIVMQYLEGQTMAERLARGPLPVSQVLRYGAEIAGALDKAHRAGIVHRDLKPGNVMLTKSGARLLDFGLAKLHEQFGPLGLSSLTHLGATAEGTILGTVHYMAPEQVEGRGADPRTDIFALGTLLFEAATGRRPFDGPSAAAVIGSILKDEPSSIISQAPLVPPALGQLVHGCLAKDPDERWQSAADIKRQLQWIATQSGAGLTGSALPPTRRLRDAGWIVAALVAAMLAIVLVAIPGRRPSTADSPTVMYPIPPPAEMTFAADIAQVPSTQFAVSDEAVAFVAAAPGRRPQLWVRDHGNTEPRLLEGTDAASYPFWSPDGKSIGFFAQGKLKRIDLAGGLPRELCNVGSDPRGGTWGQANVIVFAKDTTSGLSQVNANTGCGDSPQSLLDRSEGEYSYRWPSFLPDGRRFFFHVRASKGRSIRMGSLNSRGSKLVLEDALYGAVYAAPGYLLTVRDRTLFAYPFDENALPIAEDGLRIADNVGGSTTGRASISVSPAGVLAYAGPLATPSRLEWVDSRGTVLSATEDGDYVNFRIAPDGRRAAVTKVDQKNDTTDIWLLDANNHLERFTDDPGTETSPVWSYDGTQIMFRSDRDGGNFPFVRPANRSAEEKLVAKVETVFLTDWSNDDRIAFHSGTSGSYDVGILDRASGAKPSFVAASKFTEIDGRFSPNKRWFAYASDRSDKMRVYVAAAGSAGAGVPVGEGSEPHWGKDSDKLYFLSADRYVTVVTIGAGPTASSGSQTRLFPTSALFPGSIFRMNYDVSGDGTRFLVNTPVKGAGTSPIAVVMSWATKIRR